MANDPSKSNKCAKLDEKHHAADSKYFQRLNNCHSKPEFNNDVLSIYESYGYSNITNKYHHTRKKSIECDLSHNTKLNSSNRHKSFDKNDYLEVYK